MSDQSTKFVDAESPKDALEQFAESYSHPCGLYSAACYESADSYHKDGPILAMWLSNAELERRKATEGKGCYTMKGNSPDSFEVDGEVFTVTNPKDGMVV
jgi:hypothetical protein